MRAPPRDAVYIIPLHTCARADDPIPPARTRRKGRGFDIIYARVYIGIRGRYRMPREARYQRRHERRDRRRMRKLSTFLCGWLSRARVCGVVEIRDRVIRVVAGA